MDPIQGSRDRGHPVVFGCLGLALLAALLLPRTGQAQVLYGSIVGNVTDSSGAPMPGATVTIINNETNQSREAVTSTTGSYDFTTLQTGTYTVKLSQPGFKTLTRSDVAVRLNNVTRLDLVASVGEVTETVVVTAEPALLKTDRAEISAELTTRPATSTVRTTSRSRTSSSCRSAAADGGSTRAACPPGSPAAGRSTTSSAS